MKADKWFSIGLEAMTGHRAGVEISKKVGIEQHYFIGDVSSSDGIIKVLVNVDLGSKISPRKIIYLDHSTYEVVRTEELLVSKEDPQSYPSGTIRFVSGKKMVSLDRKTDRLTYFNWD